MSSYDIGQSVANATRSRVESGSKHIVPMKMFSEFIGHVVGGKNGLDVIYKDKYKHCCNKNQLAIGIGRTFANAPSTYDKMPHAYQPILSNLSCVANDDTGVCRAAVIMSRYFGRAAADVIDDHMNGNRDAITNYITRKYEFDNNKWQKVKEHPCLRNLPVAGVSLATIWAHPSSGDTVGSVMVGGLITVTNGPFPVTSGDQLTFIWGFEEEYFDENSKDVPIRIIPRQNGQNGTHLGIEKFDGESMKRRKMDFSMSFKGLRDANKLDLPYIIPIVHTGTPFEHVDRDRFFAKAISNARPFESLDIMLGHQCI